MIRKWLAYWAVATAALAGFLYWKNAHSYPERSARWRIGKTTADLMLIVFAATQLPALLIAWVTLWATKPIKHTAARTTTTIILGTILGLCASTATGAMEVVVFLSVFAVDLITGKQGFTGHRERYRALQQKRAA